MRIASIIKIALSIITQEPDIHLYTYAHSLHATGRIQADFILI
jgi:hypothetical protein